jgi:RNA polymerase sigma-B factor
VTVTPLTASSTPDRVQPTEARPEPGQSPDGPSLHLLEEKLLDSDQSATPSSDPHTMRLLTQLCSSTDARERRRAREELIELQRPFADFLARRFRNRGEPLEDLCQVASIGLIKAIDGFDLERGSSFAGYAIPTILGELRRHFRDKGWNVRVPRRLQELRTQIAAVTEPLTQELGRAPSTADLAEALGLTDDEIREGLAAAQAYSATSLQTPVHREDDGPTLADLVAHEDCGYEVVEARESLRMLLGNLPERERRILGLRFYSQLTQSEIAAELGISQMHVSRLLSRTLGSLRDQLQPAV